MNAFAQALVDPHWLLAGFDAAGAAFRFVETNRDFIADQAFIDGRASLSPTNRELTVSPEEAIEWLHARENACADIDRLILHVGFCGSTLLSRALDASGLSLGYREPQVLVDVAAAKGVRGEDDREWRDIIAVVRAQFRKRFRAAEASILKPSVWPLAIASDLCAGASRVVFLTMRPEEYLLAVLRGREARVEYVLKFVTHLRREFPSTEALVREVEDDVALSPRQRMLRFVLVALACQLQEFHAIASRLPSGDATWIDFDLLRDDPGAALDTAASGLAIGPWSSRDAGGVQAALGAYSKDHTLPFESDQYLAANRAIGDAWREDLDAALDWTASLKSRANF